MYQAGEDMKRTYTAPGVTVVETSLNRKTGLVSATYIAQKSCPRSCPFLDEGCYAEYGMTGIHTSRLNAQTEGTSLLELAQAEAELIDRLTGRNHLRLHVVGDSTTRQGTQKLSKACSRHRRKHGKVPFTYTHAAEKVKRENWGDAVSVLASCQDVGGLERARSRGYAQALVVRAFPGKGMFKVGGFKVIPCPQQVYPEKDIRCVDCKLCFQADRLLKADLVIGFEAHGAGARRLPLPTLEIRP